MNHRSTATLAVALVASLFACSPQDEPGVRRKGSTPKLTPPHGGQLIMLQGGNGYLEALQDQSKGNLMVWVLNGKLEPMPITDAPVLNLKGGAQSKGVPAGEGAQHLWTCTHDALKEHLHGAHIRVVVAGQTFRPEWHAPH